MVYSDTEEIKSNVDKRRFTKKDQDYVTSYIKQERENRNGSEYRKTSENIWTVIDRQIAMQPPDSWNRSGKKEDWHNQVQLGDLADALEVLSADTLRLLFPNDRWFRPHIELTSELNVETGQPERIPLDEQKKRDFVLRSLMIQQHVDFGFKDRVKSAIKEALSHGGFVAEVQWDSMDRFYDGSNIETLSSACWKTYSMWNCYPDPCPYYVGTELFYRGTMIMESFMPYTQVMRMNKWINLKDVPKDKDSNYKEGESQDPSVKITTYYGDMNIPRQQGKDMYLPNKKIILANGVFVYQETNPTPYLPIIYTGYEKDDIRNPYFTSPLIKRSPMHGIATRSANKMLDAVDLRTEPPVAYDALDPTLAKLGGVPIEPGVQIPTRGNARLQVLDTADPTWAFNALQFAQKHVQDGTGVDSTRKGVSASTEQTAFEVAKKDQKSEIRTVDFVGTMERQALLPFLYIQNDLNRSHLDNYPFYNNEINTPDFLRANKQDIPPSIRFEIVGSKEVLGEEQRVYRYTAAVNAAVGVPQISAMTDWQEIAEENWKLSGVKDPERFLKNDENQNVEAMQIQQEAEQAIQQLQQQIQQLTIDSETHKLRLAEKDAKISGSQQELRLFEERDQARRELEALEDSLLKERDRINAKIQKFKDEIQNSQITFKQSASELTPEQYVLLQQEANNINIQLENLIDGITGI